jgi:HK97 family phage portal protein
MLPLYLMRRGAGGSLEEATDHSLYDVLMYEPNGWQTPFEFKSTMQARALIDEEAYALVVKSAGRVIRLIPLTRGRVRVEQLPDYSVVYHYTRPDGGVVQFRSDEILHLRGFGIDGVHGLSRTRYAREAIGLALRTEEAAARLFKDGQMAGGAIQGENKLSPEAHARLVASMQTRHAGAENAGKWFVLEEGFEAKVLGGSAVDNQHVETRKHQVEEIARAFGVPRPLLMVDETSWGSGIEQLATMFVRFGLAPWMKAWEEAIARCCLTREERRTLRPDFDEQELLRGSMKDQAEFFSKALGSGGRGAWLVADEVRKATGYGPIEGGDKLPQPAPPSTTPPNNGNPDNEPPDPAGNQGV